MNIGIVFAPLEVSPDFIDYPYFADLGAVQIAGELRRLGHQVALFDALAMPGARAERVTPDRIHLGAPAEAVALAATRERFDAVVVALSAFHRPPARDDRLGHVLAALRDASPETPIVLADLHQGGQHVVDAAFADVLAAYPEVDAYLKHEAEATLPALLAELARSGRPGAALSMRGDDPPDLDALALPAWDLVDTGAYFELHASLVRVLGRSSWAFPIEEPSLPLLTTRGCPFRCAHCSSNPGARVEGVLTRPKTQRRLGASRMAELFELLARRGARRLHVIDELVNVNEAHFDAFLDLAVTRDLRFEIPNGVRADYVLPRHLEKMRGRTTTLSISAESGVQRVVDEVVNKQLDLRAIERAARAAEQAGVACLVHFIIGQPGETKADINATLAFAIELFEETGAEPSVQFATPLPGTPLDHEVRRRGLSLPVVHDWGPRFQQTPTIETDDFSRADLLRFKETFDRRMDASRGPKKIIMNVTYRCNNRCTFCATGTRTQLDGDYERQRELLVKYRKLGVRLLDIDGGEPSLNASLFRLIGFARKIGYEKVNVTTNARMASYADYAERLVTSGVTSVLVSIHGPDAQTHAQNVGVAEAFDQTIAGAKNLVRAAPPGVELGANITLTKSNYESLPRVAELVHDLGLPWLNVQFLTPFGRATKYVAPDTQAAADVTMRTIDAWKHAMRFQVINLPFCFMPGYEAYLLGDLLKLERHMLFVNNEEVNLFSYLRDRRKKKEACETCPHAVFCGGFFELEDVPEPTWLVRPEDLVRPIKGDLPDRPRPLRS
jgi:MoaA/NifB/PqqE/SkfB family radical SAM enzyme